MTKGTFQQALKEAQADLGEAIQQLDYWTMEVAKLQTLVKALAAKSSDEQAPDEVGIQDVVFACIRTSYLAPTAKDVRDMIVERDLYDLGRYSNPLAVIHGAIKRLEKAEKIKSVGDGKYGLNVAGILGAELLKNRKK